LVLRDYTYRIEAEGSGVGCTKTKRSNGYIAKSTSAAEGAK
jgi:hypothetical protein